MLRIDGLQRLGFGPYTLGLDDGECIAISGPSGAGKSVLLRMIADLDPHEGSAALDGRACESMRAPEWRRLVTYVAAESGWWAPAVREHFADAEGIRAALPALGLPPEILSWPVARLSSGERQRLALLRAVLQEPRVLLLDEPTSALDRENVGHVEALLRRQVAAGTALLVVTHDPAQPARLGALHLRLDRGTLSEVLP
jgi:ABC-type iron transport system FetAB ATPase subunit